MRSLRFIVVDIDSSEEARDRATPVVLSLPEDIEVPDNATAKDLVARAIKQKSPHRSWRWNRKFVFSELDASLSQLILRMFDGADWNSVEPVWIVMPDTAHEALEYVKLVGPSKSAEGILASDTYSSYKYAMEILKGVFPEGEEAIGKDALKSVNYAAMSKNRIIPGENLIAECEGLSFDYGKIMKKHGLWGSWTEDEVARSPVWMYQYAKDHMKGRLPDSLHNKMHLMSFSESDSNKWMKKYLGAKKYVLKKKRPA